MTHQRTGSQPRALAHAVHAYATHIDDPSVLAGALRHTAMRHCSVGVRAEHYPIIGRHLIAAIREVLGEIATPSVIDAWSADYNQLAAMMIALEQDRYSSAAQAPGGWSCWRAAPWTGSLHPSFRKPATPSTPPPSFNVCFPQWRAPCWSCQ